MKIKKNFVFDKFGEKEWKKKKEILISWQVNIFYNFRKFAGGVSVTRIKK